MSRATAFLPVLLEYVIPLLKALWKKIDAIDKSLASEPQIEKAKAAYIKQLKSIKGDK